MNGPARLVAALMVLIAACGGSGSDEEGPASDDYGIVEQLLPAVEAVEGVLGGPQEYFEVTATPQLVNVFVAADGGTAVLPYVYLDGELQAPGPKQTGVVGQTFTAEAIDFDETTVLTGVAPELPESSIDALSVEGGPGGVVRYVLSVRSAAGGVLDVVVSRQGSVIEVIAL